MNGKTLAERIEAATERSLDIIEAELNSPDKVEQIEAALAYLRPLSTFMLCRGLAASDKWPSSLPDEKGGSQK